ncbi:MAG TPA: carboxypeptidase M32 [Candidatus Bathyarchaeota archaeon]|nr:carboxypeptidase M32 [Candidatus Bathyarchaeota archaeon]
MVKYSRTLWALGHVSNLMGWDLEVNMPREGIKERSIATSELEVLRQKLLLQKEFLDLVEKAEKNRESLNDYERGLIRVLKRNIRIAKALPPELIRELSKVTSEANMKWRIAKKKNDYKIFEPYLERIIELEREVAEHLGYEEHPYDALLDLFEEGLKTSDMEKIFKVIEPGIRDVLKRVLDEKLYPQTHRLEKEKYEVEDMKKLNMEILRLLGYPLGEKARLDVSAHPFTTSMGIKDVRITTRYLGFDFKRSMFSVIHEFGHALYELQIDEKLMATPLATGISLGIHESQSRFWENMIGRSKMFAEVIYPTVKKYLKYVEDYSPNELYLYFNVVKPSLIRVDADEVTYNLHILLRFKLEKMMIEGEVKVDELPELWNNEMERLLGIRPKTYSEGILQDIHWSGGMGYFPTYTIGNIVAAQIRHHAIKEIDLEENMRKLNFEPLKNYLKEKIHKWGSTYPPKELLKRSFNEELNPKPFIEYINEKYLSKI